jgi:hypothetical protein
MEAGLVPNSDELAGRMIRDICFSNAERYLGLSVARRSSAGD